MSRIVFRPLGLTLALAATVAVSGAFAAQRTGASADAQARYKEDRAACMSGQSGQERETCLKEAGAALAEARRGNLSEGESRPELRSNRMDRCKVLSGDERTDCIARMRGEGTVEGSVKGGGVLREKVTIVPGKPADASTSPAPTK